MFAIVRTGGKQYRVAPGDKIVVDKIAGAAGDRVELGDVLLAGEGADLKSTEGLIVAAEIIAQAKADKVIVFKKKRRHNYRRKAGHRQQHTILRITAIGDEKAAPRKTEAAAKPVAAPKTAKAEAAPKPEAPLKAGPTRKAPAAKAPTKKAPATKAPAAKASAAKASTKKPAGGKKS